MFKGCQEMTDYSRFHSPPWPGNQSSWYGQCYPPP